MDRPHRPRCRCALSRLVDAEGVRILIDDLVPHLTASIRTKMGAPSFAYFAKGGKARTPLHPMRPSARKWVPHPSRTLRRVGKHKPHCIQCIHPHENGCPILRALCEGWESTNPTASNASIRTKMGAPSFAHFAKGGKAQTPLHPMHPSARESVPHPSRFCEGWESTNHLELCNRARVQSCPMEGAGAFRPLKTAARVEGLQARIGIFTTRQEVSGARLSPAPPKNQLPKAPPPPTR